MKRSKNRQLLQSFSLHSETLESRELLASIPASTLAGYIRNPSAYFSSPSNAIRQPDRTLTQTPAQSFAIQSADPVEVTTVRSGDPLLGYDFTLINSHAAYGFTFNQQSQSFRTDVNLTGVDIPVGSMMQLEILTSLKYWNGSGRPSFTPVQRNVEVNLRVFGQDLRVGARTDQGGGSPSTVIRRNLNIAVSDGQPINRQMEATIGTGGTLNRFASPGAPTGIYAFTALWSVQNADGVRDSAPITFVFRIGNVSNQAFQAAIASFEAPATRQVAPVAMISEFIEPDGFNDSFVRVTVEFSDPVSAAGRSPQLPLYFGNTLRYAELERNTNQTNVNTLTFTYRPSSSDLLEPRFRIGSSIRLQPGSQLKSSGGTPVILSLPETSQTTIPVDSANKYVTISSDITRNTTLKAGSVYVITGEVHVNPGVTLTIEDGVTVLIRNGRIRGRFLTSPALIFDSGSKLRAQSVYFKACDIQNVEQAYANNGGVFFLGTFRNASKDGISVDTANIKGYTSSFVADKIVVSYLGRTDPRGGDGDDNLLDDIDGISILGMGQTEWRVKAVQSEYSGDDGFDVTNSSISLESLIVTNPVEDGLNISSSTVNVKKQLSVVMSLNRAPDRELFDLEVDDGPSYVNISRLASVDLRGYWGNIYDEVSLNSPDMPQPPKRSKTNEWYEFIGILQKGPARIYSITAD